MQSLKPIKIASICPHFGEEPPLSGTRGSGTIFFSNCTMRCVYCQNWQISQGKSIGEGIGIGKEYSEDELVGEFLKLQEAGCHNINLVSPTQFAVPIARALKIAKRRGLLLPIVYNTNGFDQIKTLKNFNGLVDIYLPDIKYSDNVIGYEYSSVKNYVERNRAAITEMYQQVGDLEIDENGIAKRGLIIRHLVMPNGLAGSYAALKFIASLSKEIWLSLMAQYYPCYRAKEYPMLDRRIKPAEYQQVLDWAEELGLANILIQELASADSYQPDFQKDKPFS